MTASLTLLASFEAFPTSSTFTRSFLFVRWPHKEVENRRGFLNSRVSKATFVEKDFGYKNLLNTERPASVSFMVRVISKLIQIMSTYRSALKEIIVDLLQQTQNSTKQIMQNQQS